jgi:phenylacetate-CoA ligase
MDSPQYHIAAEELLDGAALASLQRRKLGALLSEVRATNPFYRRKFDGISFNPATDLLETLPLTTRKELEQDQAANPIYGSDLTYPLARYTRFHQTSGSSGAPLRWLDTPESWDWFKECWGIVFAAAGISKGRGDSAVFPFSFGPFVGFWAAFEASTSLGMRSLAGGGMTTVGRLRLIIDNQATVICCTPTYALRMAEVAAQEGLDIRRSAVRALVVAGEPGGSIPETRQRIESAWGARVFDHTGMTEIGPLGFECEQNPGGVHLIESECIAEVIDPHTLRPVEPGELGELVITNLGRTGSPVIRYRTGDQVRLSRQQCKCGRHFARMDGGILGRIDEMIVVRGNNVFPSAIEAVIRRFAEVAEYRVQAYDQGALTQVRIELEPAPGTADGASSDLGRRVGKAIQDALSFRAEILTVSVGTLPRFEMKARRFVRVQRTAEGTSEVTTRITS